MKWDVEVSMKKRIGIIAITVILIVISANYVLYGTVNLFGEPKRVFINGHVYYNDHGIMILEAGKSNGEEVSGFIEKITNKKFYKLDDKMIIFRLTGNLFERYEDNVYRYFYKQW